MEKPCGRKHGSHRGMLHLVSDLLTMGTFGSWEPATYIGCHDSKYTSINSWSFTYIDVHSSSHSFMHCNFNCIVHTSRSGWPFVFSPASSSDLTTGTRLTNRVWSGPDSVRSSKMSPNWVLLPLRDPALLLFPWWKAMKPVLRFWTRWEGNILSISRRYHISVVCTCMMMYDASSEILSNSARHKN